MELCMETECKYGSMVYGMYLYIKNYKHGDDENFEVIFDTTFYTVTVNIKKEFIKMRWEDKHFRHFTSVDNESIFFKFRL
jgi:hypothetical protein